MQGWGLPSSPHTPTVSRALPLQVLFAPSEEEVRRDKTFRVHIRDEDFLIPVCPDGIYRSQVCPPFLSLSYVFSAHLPSHASAPLSLHLCPLTL